MNAPPGQWIVCARCNAAIDPGASYCPSCGQSLPHPIGLACPHCAAINLNGSGFCETCGAVLPPRPHLVVSQTGLRLSLFANDQDAIIVGRSDTLSGMTPDLDLEPYVGELAGLSRRHARLTLRDNQCWIEDLNSVNWTYVNNQRLAPERPVPLQNGDLLRLGNVYLTFRSN